MGMKRPRIIHTEQAQSKRAICTRHDTVCCSWAKSKHRLRSHQIVDEFEHYHESPKRIGIPQYIQVITLLDR
jgi:hypothetical protein